MSLLVVVVVVVVPAVRIHEREFAHITEKVSRILSTI